MLGAEWTGVPGIDGESSRGVETGVMRVGVEIPVRLSVRGVEGRLGVLIPVRLSVRKEGVEGVSAEFLRGGRRMLGTSWFNAAKA